MTRISSFGLYQCPKCGQIHIKPEYGSISAYIPSDLFNSNDDIKKCKGCPHSDLFRNYIFLGLRSKKNSNNPNRFHLLLRKIMKKPYIEEDVRKLYPFFD